MGLLTTSQLAVELGLSPSTVRALATRGQIPSRRTPGGHHRFDPAEVRAALGAAATPPSLGALRSRRDEIHRVARRHGARNIRVVGSVARGEQGAGSDVDLLVELEAGRTLFDVAALHDDLEELLQASVDIVTQGAVRGRLADLDHDAIPL